MCFLAIRIELLLTDAPDMRDIMEGGNRFTARGIVVAFVQAEMLRRFRSGLGALHHDGLQGGGQELGIVDVRPSQGRAQRAAIRVDDQAPLYPFFPRAVGLRPTKSPPVRALPMAVSAACHCQSTPLRASHCSTNAAQMRSKIPR